MTWADVMVPNYATPGITLVRGEGHTVWADDGTAYTDLLAGIAVNILGHAHPDVVTAVQHQAAALMHTSNMYGNPPALELAAALRKRTGHRVLLVNSGTEANEAALKAVRKYAASKGRSGVVLAFHQAFHGRTLGALALTGQPAYHDGFGPLPDGIVHIPFNDPDALRAAFVKHDVIGVFAECVQGEGGVLPMTQDAADALGALCRQHDALLVVDEVQTGIARTGRFLASEHLGLQPDIITLAKGLGGGMPIGACLMRDDVAAVMVPGTHGCTFGGNPVSCAAANAVLSVVARDRLAEKAASDGGAVIAALAAHGLQARGQGLLIGIPVARPAKEVVAAMAAKGFLVGQAGAHVVRLAPPLTVPRDVLMDAVEALAACLAPTLESSC